MTLTPKLKTKLETDTLKFGWVSLPCTRLSSPQNLMERDEEAWAKFLKKQGQDLRHADEIAQSLERLCASGDIAWEWPKSAVKGWRSSSIRRLERLAQKYNRTIYKINIDGCAYGMTWNGLAIKKGWQILTSSRTLWLMVAKRCPQNHTHGECRGQEDQALAYYPKELCMEIRHAMEPKWNSMDYQTAYLMEKHLFGLDNETLLEYHETDPSQYVMALSRTRLNLRSSKGQEARGNQTDDTSSSSSFRA